MKYWYILMLFNNMLNNITDYDLDYDDTLYGVDTFYGIDTFYGL